MTRGVAAIAVLATAALAAPAAYADDDFSLGVPPPPEQQAVTISVSAATRHARYALADRFPTSYLLRHAGRTVCDGDGTTFKCLTAWRYRGYAYRGRLTVVADETGSSVDMRVVRTGHRDYRVYV